MTTWIKSFIDSLERIIEKPPYLIFVFISAVFIAISLIFKFNFEKMLIFFLYSIAGTMWRYAEKDFVTPFKGYSKSKIIIRAIYHLGNFGLLIALIYYISLT